MVDGLRRYKAIFESAVDFAIVATDRDGKVTDWNPGAEHILGWSAHEMCGSVVDRIFTPEDRDADRPNIEMSRSLEQGRANDERWHLRKDGRRFWANGEMMPLKDEDGTPVGFLKIMRDQTAQRRVQDAHNARLALQDVLRSLGDVEGMAAKAAEIIGSTLDVGVAGYAAVDAAGEHAVIERDWVSRDMPSLVGSFRLADFGKLATDLKRGAPVVIEDVRLDHRTSGYADAFEKLSVRALAKIPLIERGHLAAYFFVASDAPREWSDDDVAFVKDVAERTRAGIERVRAENALQDLATTLQQQVEERTRERDRIWQVSRDMLGVADVDGIWWSINPAWTATLGWQADAFIGKTSEWVEHPDDRLKTRAEIAKLAAGKSTLAFENRFRTADGDYRDLSWTAVPLDNMLYCVGRDVTEQKRHEVALFATQEQLRQSQKVEAVGQLTGGVAHDFNNLLTVIRGSVDLLRRPDLSEDRRKRYIDAIADTSDRAAKLTSQLLAFARRQALKPQVFDVADSVQALQGMIGTLTGSRIDLVIDAGDCPCFINADRSQFDTALVNMAVNARDAMQGVGRLTIAVGNAAGMPAIRSHPAVAGNFVTVALSDTGAGISSDRIDRIFEPFYTTKGVGEGTGLGLSQVFGFAKQSGGEIMVDSVEGAGATFTLYLPKASEPEAVSGDDRSTARARFGEGACILVVEDNAEVGTFAAQALAELGYETSMVSDAATALERLATSHGDFDLVFSDVVMPGMSGIELGREIRRLYPHMPVVLTSGYSNVLAQEGSHGFELLQKPYSIDELGRVFQRFAEAR